MLRSEVCSRLRYVPADTVAISPWILAHNISMSIAVAVLLAMSPCNANTTARDHVIVARGLKGEMGRGCLGRSLDTK